MGHPYAALRQSKVEKSRVGHITKGYASGGAVHGDEKQDRKLIRKMVGEMVPEGAKAKHRADRPNRAKGGRVKGNAKTIVNVITGGHPAAGAVPPMPAPPMGVAPAGAMPPPRPPMAPPPAAGPGMAPPMPMRAKGGRVGKAGGGGVASQAAKDLADAYAVKPWYGPQAQAAREAAGKAFVSGTKKAQGGRVNQGTAVFEEGRRNGTRVQHDPGKNDIDPKNLNRPRVVTFNTGGGVKSFKVGGRVESPDGVAKASKLPGGAGGGEARLTKAHRQARRG